ncbi:MAG: zinc ribbon domain-containing protein [Acidobacteria bacterium]|jgi:putative FmdB family regulatory protein|nr:zinc ribbon domain-containing protein [Acidobacteriota bacterium]
MPIYEYKCLKCGKTFEALQSVSAEPIAKCLYCRGRARKIISVSSFQFKGSGWYLTDYKKKVAGDTTDAVSDKKSTPAKKADKKSDKNANIN